MTRKELPSLPWKVGGNKFHYLMQHVGQSLRDMGANMDTFDTQNSERSNMAVKENYRKSSKRQHSRQEEMVQRTLFLKTVSNLMKPEVQLHDHACQVEVQEDEEKRETSNKTFSAADNIPHSRLRKVKISRKECDMIGWTFTESSSEIKYLHPIISTDHVSECLEDITSAFTSEPPQVFDLEVYLMASVTITGGVLSLIFVFWATDIAALCESHSFFICLYV